MSKPDFEVTVVTAEDEWDGRSRIDFHIGNKEYSFCDGEPEDNGLCRNFNDIYSIPEMLKAAHKAGKEGRELKIKRIEEEW